MNKKLLHQSRRYTAAIKEFHRHVLLSAWLRMKRMLKVKIDDNLCLIGLGRVSAGAWP